MSRVPKDQLVAAGLDLMKRTGQPLERVPSTGNAMIYLTAGGKTVRVRTCNDHILIVLASRDEEGARLNIEGTDLLLLVYPRIERTPGPVDAFLLPVHEVAEAARTTHRDWLATNPRTSGDNRTWNLWFDDDGPAKANGFATKWARYKLPGEASTMAEVADQPQATDPPRLGDVIAEARTRIAEVAGVPPEAVRISIDLT